MLVDWVQNGELGGVEAPLLVGELDSERLFNRSTFAHVAATVLLGREIRKLLALETILLRETLLHLVEIIKLLGLHLILLVHYLDNFMEI